MYDSMASSDKIYNSMASSDKIITYMYNNMASGENIYTYITVWFRLTIDIIDGYICL